MGYACIYARIRMRMGLRIDKNVGRDGSFGRAFDIIKAAAISPLYSAIFGERRSPEPVAELPPFVRGGRPRKSNRAAYLRAFRSSSCGSRYYTIAVCARRESHPAPLPAAFYAALSPRLITRHNSQKCGADTPRDTRVASFLRRRLIWTLPPPNGAFAPRN